ncbi:MAG: hypothetical protein MUE52_17250 [Tabrizicola sp.]|jgi:hypothetical protein|nr:hypothetical protein [Tabrizicola sp.]
MPLRVRHQVRKLLDSQPETTGAQGGLSDDRSQFMQVARPIMPGEQAKRFDRNVAAVVLRGGTGARPCVQIASAERSRFGLGSQRTAMDGREQTGATLGRMKMPRDDRFASAGFALDENERCRCPQLGKQAKTADQVHIFDHDVGEEVPDLWRLRQILSRSSGVGA